MSYIATRGNDSTTEHMPKVVAILGQDRLYHIQHPQSHHKTFHDDQESMMQRV